MDPLNHLVIRALNHMIQGEHWAQERLQAHSGALVLITTGLFTIRLGVNEHGLFHYPDGDVFDADVTITLPSDVPVRLLIDRDKLFSSVKLGGSADIAESLAFVLRNLEWDVEADLARLVGDIPARRLARLGQALAKAIQDSAMRAAENVVEYAVEESSLLAANREIIEFSGSVNCLRDDVARLEKRISRL